MADQPNSRNVFINRTKPTREQLAGLDSLSQVPVPDGHYWYDATSGAWGVEGGPTSGVGHPGLDLPGPMPSDISGGGTGIFINGRDIHPQEQLFLQSIFGAALPGRYWLDAQGILGVENGMLIANLFQAAAAAQGQGATPSNAGTVAVDDQGMMFSSGGVFFST